MTTQSSRRTGLPRRVRTLLPLLLVILLTLPALQPLWQPGLQQTDDGAHHLFRLFNLDLAQRSGHPGTRWLADESHNQPVVLVLLARHNLQSRQYHVITDEATRRIRNSQSETRNRIVHTDLDCILAGWRIRRHL